MAARDLRWSAIALGDPAHADQRVGQAPQHQLLQIADLGQVPVLRRCEDPPPGRRRTRSSCTDQSMPFQSRLVSFLAGAAKVGSCGPFTGPPAVILAVCTARIVALCGSASNLSARYRRRRSC